jgi:integrase
MGVKIRKRGSKWWLVVDYHGRRKSKCIGTSRHVAEQVKRQVEAKLALGDLGFVSERARTAQTFDEYSSAWLKRYAELECKASTAHSYEQLLRLHVRPQFGTKKLTEITRDEIKQFLSELSARTRLVNDVPVPRFARNTLRLIVCALRTVLNAAVEDGLLENNPASKVGKFAKTERPAHQASAMTRDEAEQFLAAVYEGSPEWRAFFLTALRTGLRKGELIALKWGDIQLGQSPEDPNRYILVQRNYSHGRFTSPKSKKSRRVDLSKQLRQR